MRNSIFRQRSLDRISSPEQLNDYIKVANPSAFISLAGIIILLLGICIWGIFGQLDTIVKFVAVVQEGNMQIYMSEDIATVNEVISVEDTEVTIKEVNKTPISAKKVDEYILHVLEVGEDTFLYQSYADTSLDDGVYPGEIVTESIHPMYFITN